MQESQADLFARDDRPGCFDHCRRLRARGRFLNRPFFCVCAKIFLGSIFLIFRLVVSGMYNLHSFFRKIDSIWPARDVYAHCDIPCGIYDPHTAQLAANTIVRMVQLINALPKLTMDLTPEQRLEIVHKLSRYVSVKEEHAELCKKELRILWGDYFKPEHAQKFPELHELFFKAMKQASKARQEASMAASEELLETVNKIADIFWKTKDVPTIRRKSFYPTEKEIIVPKA